MDKHYQLSITDDTTEISIDTINTEEFARLLSLAGVSPTTPPMPHQSPPTNIPTPVGPTELPPLSISPSPDSGEVSHSIDMPFDGQMSDGCAVCGAEDHTEMDCPDVITSQDDEMIGELADFDLINQDNDSEGHEVDKDSYMWQGPATNQRMVKGMQGDNPLIAELHDKLLSKYEEYLSEDIDPEDQENVAAGRVSPLTNPTKATFDKDPTSGEEQITDGTRSPLSRIKRQDAFK